MSAPASNFARLYARLRHLLGRNPSQAAAAQAGGPNVYQQLRATVDRGEFDAPAADRARALVEEAIPAGWDALLTDATLAGWFNRSRRELYTGFALDADDLVVDVGCGDGAYAHFCAEFVRKVILVDLDPHSLALAASRIGDLAAKVETLQAGADSIALPSGCADKIIATEILEHVADPRACMRELVRLGKPGARYLISVPHPAAENLQRPLAPDYYFRPPNHIHVFEPQQFERLVSRAGLRIEARGSYGFFWTLWWMFFWASGRRIDEPHHSILQSWTETWGKLLRMPERGRLTKEALDLALPKSQILVARKPG